MILGSGLLQSANTFVGAYDAIPSIAAAYSTRRLLTSYTGPLLRLVADRTGYPEQDIGYTAAGDLDTAAAATFLDGDDGYIATWYDQSGNTRNATQATLANMPLYVASGQNSKPVLHGAGTQQLQASHVSELDAAPGMIILAVATEDAGNISNAGIAAMRAGNDGFVLDNLNSSSGARFAHPGGGGWGEAADLLSLGLLKSPSILIGRFDGSVPQNELRRNGVQIDSTATTGATVVSNVAPLYLMARDLGAAPWQGNLCEVLICNAALTAIQVGSAESAANAYWSIY